MTPYNNTLPLDKWDEEERRLERQLKHEILEDEDIDDENDYGPGGE